MNKPSAATTVSLYKMDVGTGLIQQGNFTPSDLREAIGQAQMKKEETMINRNSTTSATTTFFKVFSVCFLYCAYRSSSSLVDKINSSNKKSG
ncbi:MAG: hypothetical protein HKM00_10340 [Gallionella sp.]|jgi:hypothetical protein|nr:hypothetical protein [Gallionella sp.]